MVNIWRRRALALAGAGLGLGVGGCAVEEAARAADPAPVPGGGGGLLTPWLTLNGGWRLDPQAPLTGARPLPGPRIPFGQPVGVAARTDMLLVADAATRTIWRVDRSRDAMLAFAPLASRAAEASVSMQLGSDFAAWVALPAEGAVLQHDHRGRLLRRWVNEMDIPRPVAVAVPEDRSRVLIGDGASARIVVFDPLGRPQGVLGGRRVSPLQSITAMSFGPRGLYVLDRLSQQVVVLDPRGEPVEIIGENQLVQPRAMAVDRSGRVFVADDAQQRIKVFRGPELLASAGGPGAAPGRFGRIESMALDGNMLYVADSMNARVQIMLVAPAAFDPPASAR
jgi:sugar lactone lactonase YvrE